MNPLKTEFAESKTFRLSKRLTVEVTVGTGGLLCEWTPSLPKRLTGRELVAYRTARDQMLERLAVRLGRSYMVVEA